MDYKSIVFREFTPESFQRIKHFRQEEAERVASELSERQTTAKDENNKRHTSNKQQHINNSTNHQSVPNKELAAGQTLPRLLQNKFPAELIGKPIEEIDSFYRTDYIFVVINRNYTIFRFSATRSFFLLSPFNCVRRLATHILTHPLFSTIVMLTILTNCVFMTMRNAPESTEYVFTIIYTLEALTKCIARGFILQKYTFLRDPWNWLDFAVISLAYVTFFVNLGKLGVLRTFRVLRALKTVAVVPGLKTIVNALIQSFFALRDVSLLSSFILSIFALIGLQLYMGILRQKCVPTYESFVNSSNYTNMEFNISYTVYLKEIDNETYWYKENELYVLCGNASGSIQCPDGYVCWKDRGMNPDFGYTSFDNYGWAMLACFRLMTQDYWENLYQLILSSAGRYHFVYFLAIIFFGSFYLVNLILAIVSMSYLEQQKLVESENEERERRKIQDEAELQSERADSALEADAHLHFDNEPIIKNTLFFRGRRRKFSCSSAPMGFEQHDDENNQANSIRVSRTLPSMLPLIKANITLPSVTTTDIITVPIFDELQSIDEDRKSQQTNYCIQSPERNQDDYNSIATDFQIEPNEERHQTTELSSYQALNDTSIHWGKQCSVLYKVDRTIDNKNNLLLEYDFQLTLNEHERQLYYHYTKCMNIATTNVNTDVTYDQAIINFLKVYWEKQTCELSIFEKIQKAIRIFILDAFVDLFITICIILNTLFMAVDHPGQSEKMTRILTAGNYVFTSIFTAECVLKIIAMTPVKFFKSGWNIFDLLIVTVSLVELGLANVKGLSVLRSFRLLRVFKLAKSWKTLNRLMSIIGQSLGALGNLTLVLVIIIFIFAVVGMQLFGQKYQDKFDKDMPRWNFFDFFHAFMIVFRVLCGEWIESMWVCLECAGWPCIPFFLLTFVIGNLVILNLFLALLLASFSSDVFSEKEDEENKIAEAIDRIQRFCRFVIQFTLRVFKRTGPEQQKTSTETAIKENLFDVTLETMGNNHVSKLEETNVIVETAPNDISTVKENIEMQSMDNNTASSVPTWQTLHKAPDCCPMAVSKCLSCCAKCIPKCLQERWAYFRSLAHLLVEQSAFEWLIIFSILVSSATLALEDVHTRKQPKISEILALCDKIFTVVFTVELILKWFAYGITDYFKNGWNRLDFLIVAVSILGTTLDLFGVADIPAFKSMRTLRALRPLKALSRFEGIRVVVNALFGAIPSIFNVLLVCLVFWLIFSIMGVQLFGGKFYKCVYDGTHTRVNISENVVNKTDCLNKNLTWENSRINFDNVLNGYLALFQVATFKGWIEIMADATDATDIHSQPEYEHNVYVMIYFVLFIVFGSFFTLNLFIGVVIDNFNQQKRILRAEGSANMFMTEDQKKYYNAMKKIGNKKPTKALPRPRFPVARFLFDLTSNQKFDIFIMLCICLNMLCMCLEHHNQSQTYDLVLGYINTFFVAIFTLECAMKLIALNLKYFTVPWNVFDFVIVIASILGQTLGEIMAKFFVNPTLLRVVRVARVGRILRLVKGAKGIRTLLFALVVSMPALLNIGLLLFLVMFIYSIFGMSFFAYVRKSAGITDLFNFETFPNSMIVLFQMCTTAGWSGVYQALTNDQPPDCDPTIDTPSNKGDCGDMTIATPFIITYVIITSLVVVNMYIAVILENFSQAQEDVQQGLTDDDYDMYYEKWQRFDPSGSQFIRCDQLSDFLDELEPPLRIPKPNYLALVAMNLPICENDRVHSIDILDGLTKYFLGTLSTEIITIDTAVPIDIKKDRPKDYHPITTTAQRQRELYLSRMVVRAFRANVERRRKESNNKK